jgi:hypothetical protein
MKLRLEPQALCEGKCCDLVEEVEDTLMPILRNLFE